MGWLSGGAKSVAKASGTASKRGAFFDSVADRFTDFLLFGGCAWYLVPQGRIALLPFALAGAASLVSYQRAKAESLGFNARGGLIESSASLDIGAGDLDFMQGRRLGIEVSDLGLAWVLELDGDRLRAVDAAAEASVRGSATDLLLLAQPGAVADGMVLQALASGLGIVAFDQGAAAQHIRHGHNGALALPDDADSFATATTWLLEDPETLRRVRLNARQYAGRHSWSNISQHLEGYLCSACASP